MRTINKIITKCNCQYGAPMGRGNEGQPPLPFEGTKVYNCHIPLNSGGYDRGGAYWGLGKQLRCEYTKDLKYIRFYRLK